MIYALGDERTRDGEDWHSEQIHGMSRSFMKFALVLVHLFPWMREHQLYVTNTRTFARKWYGKSAASKNAIR